MYSINLLWIQVDSRLIIEASKQFYHWGLDLCLLGLNTKPYFQATSISFHRWAACSASTWPWTVISSAIPMQPSHSSSIWSILFWKTSWEQARPKERCKKQYQRYGVLKVVSKLDLQSRKTAQYPCLASNFVKHLEWANSRATSSIVGVQWLSLWMGLLRAWGSKQMCNSPDAFQAYYTDETQSVDSFTRMMTPSFTILSNSASTLGCMEIGHFQGACMMDWALSHSLMVYSAQNWPMPWNLSGNFLMRSSVDLIGTVFLGAGGARVGPGRLGSVLDDLDNTVHFDNFQSLTWWESQNGRTRGVYHTPTGVYLLGLCTGGTRLPDDGPMKWSKKGYSGTIVGSEPSIAHIKASWVACLDNAIRIGVSEGMQW